MLRHLHINMCFFICAALLMLHGCDKCEMASSDKDATLQIMINTPGSFVEVKSVSSNPDSPDTWTRWERAVDGRFLYRVTAFILQGNRLVAYKDLELNGEPDRANINFEANFTHGTYTLMIVANYSSFEAEDGSNGTKKYDGLSGFSDTVQEILTCGTIDNFTQTYADSFLKYQIASENGVCKRVPQPLTLVKEIELHPGTNVISGELLRTYSRVRIALENSSDEALSIFSMSFADVFTQNKSYLFPDYGYPGQRTAINVTSSNALTPFTGTDASPMIIPAKSLSVIFDAYILESNKTTSSEEYTYTLNLGYDQLNLYALKSTTAVSQKNGISTGRYLIYSNGSKNYLTAGASNVTVSSLGTLKNGMSISDEYVWCFVNTGQTDKYYIGTANALNDGQTAYYMSNPSSSSVTLGANKSVNFTASNKNNYITFQSSGTGNYRYLSSSNNMVLGQKNTTTNTSYAQFLLYPVEMLTSSNVSIPVRTINSVTGQAEDIDQISRNDFINALVKVSYSKNKGHFIYEVKDWNTGGGDVEFN